MVDALHCDPYYDGCGCIVKQQSDGKCRYCQCELIPHFYCPPSLGGCGYLKYVR